MTALDQPDVDDDLWSATGDPTRRRVIDQLLREGAGTATSVSDGLTVTRQAVARHLGVLEQVALVHATTSGRERIYTVDRDRLAHATTQLAAVGHAWDARLDRIKQLAEDIQRQRDA